MYQLYYCPNCRATIYYQDRFCGNCGVSLKWIEAQTLHANPTAPHRKTNEDQQNGYRQDHCHQEQHIKSVQHSHNHRAHKPLSGSPKRQRKENTTIGLTAVKDKTKPADDNTELLKSEVTKLLESLR